MTSPITPEMRRQHDEIKALAERLEGDGVTPDEIVSTGRDYLQQQRPEASINDQETVLSAIRACKMAGIPLVLIDTMGKVRDVLI